MKFFENARLKKVMNTILLVFTFYIVAAASFSGFFVKWGFLETIGGENNRNSFYAIYDGTAYRPFVNRQLMPKIAKELNEKILHNNAGHIINEYQKGSVIPSIYPKAKIEPRLSTEYHLVYFMCVLFMMLSMFIWREIGIELTGSGIAGILTAVIFAIIFPILETVGGYFYDFGELLFFSSAVLFACKGWWLALIVLVPIAEYNKESFLFFSVTLFPFLAAKLGNKKATLAILSAVIFSGLTYLYISNIYAGNTGGSTEFHLMRHIEQISDNWFHSEITYGMPIGQGAYLPHILIVLWIVCNAWKNLPLQWKHHIYFALAINIPLYLLFCWPGEIRNLSMLYMGFIAMLSIYIKNLITVERRIDF